MVDGHRGHRGSIANNRLEKNVNVVQEHALNQYRNMVDECVKEQQLRLLNVKVLLNDKNFYCQSLALFFLISSRRLVFMERMDNVSTDMW